MIDINKILIKRTTDSLLIIIYTLNIPQNIYNYNIQYYITSSVFYVVYVKKKSAVIFNSISILKISLTFLLKIGEL